MKNREGVLVSPFNICGIHLDMWRQTIGPIIVTKLLGSGNESKAKMANAYYERHQLTMSIYFE